METKQTSAISRAENLCPRPTLPLVLPFPVLGTHNPQRSFFRPRERSGEKEEGFPTDRVLYFHPKGQARAKPLRLRPFLPHKGPSSRQTTPFPFSRENLGRAKASGERNPSLSFLKTTLSSPPPRVSLSLRQGPPHDKGPKEDADGVSELSRHLRNTKE